MNNLSPDQIKAIEGLMKLGQLIRASQLLREFEARAEQAEQEARDMRSYAEYLERHQTKPLTPSVLSNAIRRGFRSTQLPQP